MPHATELLFALGLGDDVVGVTHECDYPEAAQGLPPVTRDVLEPGLSPGEIDAAVRERTARGRVDLRARRGARARARARPHRHAGALPRLRRLRRRGAGARADAARPAARHLARSRRPTARPSATCARSPRRRTPRTRRWTSSRAPRGAPTSCGSPSAARRARASRRWSGWTPSSSPGHWTPQLIEMAGGEDVLGFSGEPSRAGDVGGGRRGAAGDRRSSCPAATTRRARSSRPRTSPTGCARSAPTRSSPSTRRRTSRGPGRASSTASSCSPTSCIPTACRRRRPKRSRWSWGTLSAGPRTVLYLHSSAGRYGADRQLALIAGGLDPRALPRRSSCSRWTASCATTCMRRRRRGARAAAGGDAARGDVARRARADRRRAGARRRRPRAPGPRAATSRSCTRTPPSRSAAAPPARVARIPHVWHLREIYTGFERYWPAYRRLLLSADALPCVSQATRDQLGDDAEGERAARRPAARAGARRARRRARGAGPAAGRVRRRDPRADLDVEGPGRPDPRARRDPATTPAARSRSSRATRGRARSSACDDLRALAGELGVADRVRFAGFRADVENVYGAADVVAVPRRSPTRFPTPRWRPPRPAAASSPPTTAGCRRCSRTA